MGGFSQPTEQYSNPPVKVKTSESTKMELQHFDMTAVMHYKADTQSKTPPQISLLIQMIFIKSL